MGRSDSEEIKKAFEQASEEQLPELIRRYGEDERATIRRLAEKHQKKLDALALERERMYQLFSYERQYQDYEFICGIDEAGRGPWVGPVVAGAVILPKDCDILYVNDSKKLSEAKREELYDVIREKAVAWAVGMASEQRIDEINILQATYEAMRQAISKLSTPPSLLLNDAVIIPGVDLPQVKIIKGDAKSASIGAASIMAKVTRDRMLLEFDQKWPEYHFAKNKGYGTKEHIEALRKYGPTPIHRKSFIHDYV